jgi:hypothetical protein
MTKTCKLLATLTLPLALAFAAATHAAGPHDHSPKHGGVVVEANDMDFELVAKPDTIVLHVRDHGKGVSLEGATAKLTLLNGSDKSEATLAPAGDRLQAKGSFKVATGTKVVALVSLKGKKAANVRFVVK